MNEKKYNVVCHGDLMSLTTFLNHGADTSRGHKVMMMAGLQSIGDARNYVAKFVAKSLGSAKSVGDKVLVSSGDLVVCEGVSGIEWVRYRIEEVSSCPCCGAETSKYID